MSEIRVPATPPAHPIARMVNYWQHPHRRPAKPWTPALDARSDVIASGHNQVISEFLDWLEGRGIVLARWFEDKEKHPDSNYRHVLTPAHERHNDLVHRFFDLDPVRVATEQTILLQYVRAVQDYDDDQRERAARAVALFEARRGADE